MDATQKLPVFDESVGVDWEASPLVERVPGRVSGVPTLKYSRPACCCYVREMATVE
jgi:hypothetical protein